MKKVTITMTRICTREVSHTIDLPDDFDIEFTADFLSENEDLFQPHLELACILAPDNNVTEEFRYDVTKEELITRHLYGGHL